MATKLDKTISRELVLKHQARQVIVSLMPAGAETLLANEMIEFRLKGTQQKVRVPVQDVFRFAMRAAVTGSR